MKLDFFIKKTICKLNALLNCFIKVEEDEPTGYVRYEKFEPTMMKILMERK